MAAERSYRALGTLTPEFPILGGGLRDRAMSVLFIIVTIPFLVGSFVSSRIPCFVPKRRSQRGVVVSRA